MAEIDDIELEEYSLEEIVKGVQNYQANNYNSLKELKDKAEKDDSDKLKGLLIFTEDGATVSIEANLEFVKNEFPKEMLDKIKYITYSSRIYKDYLSAKDAAEKGQIGRRDHYINEITKHSAYIKKLGEKLAINVSTQYLIADIKATKKIFDFPY